MAVIHFKINPIYVYLRKHKCPKCNCKLTVSYFDKIISDKDLSSIYHSIGENYFEGEVVIRTFYFICSTCGSKILINEMKHYEMNEKKHKSINKKRKG